MRRIYLAAISLCNGTLLVMDRNKAIKWNKYVKSFESVRLEEQIYALVKNTTLHFHEKVL